MASEIRSALSVEVFFFPGVEELDAVGPWEVLRFWQDLGDRDVRVRSVSVGGQGVECFKGLKVGVDGPLGDQTPDILIYPGGPGTQAMAANEDHVAEVRRLAEAGSVMASVCTGAFVLGAAGVLGSREVTTHWMARKQLAEQFTDATVWSGARWVDSGSVVTSAGVSAGIDMALHLVDRFDGRTVALRVASAMEYPWRPENDEPEAPAPAA
ncbi:ThiJ/PfpI family protein [Leucobacter sp. 7(1)]|uniref:DJ-1/PfpI family protein n=1 Tax=Microbacteriaceae TaxID=85023 RepID=UPI00097EF7A4|nr:DJ-1/PfpI family protein [Leucobacter sp. 7(1)]SJN10402.1 ThiJ/PfpI family protein [Leucobacter sp. 7(1)]